MISLMRTSLGIFFSVLSPRERRPPHSVADGNRKTTGREEGGRRDGRPDQDDTDPFRLYYYYCYVTVRYVRSSLSDTSVTARYAGWSA